MKVYQKYINELSNLLKSSDEKRFMAQQLLKLHSAASKKSKPLIVELGVDKGQSTKVFLNAIDKKKGAKLISIDIRNCSNAAKADGWEFIMQDSTDIESLLKSKPIIKKGIDILYIDSLHTAGHVKKEIYNFFLYLKKDSLVFFDDIDSTPYMQNQRKDSIGIEIANREIFKLLEAIFRANMDKLDFEIMRGSTGLGIFKKLNDIGKKLNPPKYIKERKFNFFGLSKLTKIFLNKIKIKNSY